MNISSKKKALPTISVLTLLLTLSITLIAGVAIAAKDGRSNSGVSGPDEIETSHLTFMREEEKLARDVYITLSEMYPEQPLFSKIAMQSEQTHTDTIRDKLSQLGIPDPNPLTNSLPESLGVFMGNEWGWYFVEKYAQLIAMSSENELAALYVGALIEELDMNDIEDCPQVMIDAGYPDPCGLHYTNEKELVNTYSSLLDGSENHLRAYVEKIEAVIGKGNYEAQYLNQDVVDKILRR